MSSQISYKDNKNRIT